MFRRDYLKVDRVGADPSLHPFVEIGAVELQNLVAKMSLQEKGMMIVYLDLESFNIEAEKFLLQVNCRSRGFVPFEVGGDFVRA
jgi:hypothetical protein